MRRREFSSVLPLLRIFAPQKDPCLQKDGQTFINEQVKPFPLLTAARVPDVCSRNQV